MPDRAQIISELASKAKMDPSSAVREEEIPEGYGYMMKKYTKKLVEPKERLKVEPLPTPKDKEAEVEDLLSESETEVEKKAAADAAKEKATYARLEKQGMSDQGIVSPEELVAAGKKVYRKVKSKVKSMME